MHEATRFALFVPDLLRADRRLLPGLFVASLGEALAAEGIPSKSFDPAATIITRADVRCRSVLGRMNDLVFQTRLRIEDDGGLSRCDLRVLRHFMNDTLLQGTGWRIRDCVGARISTRRSVMTRLCSIRVQVRVERQCN
jgi:hypothetical protein